MIQKNELTSIINKYYLAGLVESVKWDVKDNNLTIDFNSPNKEMIGKVSFSRFPLEDIVLAINDTSQLLKLINITSDDLKINLNKTNNFVNKLIIQDSNFKLNYSLADLIIIPKTGQFEDEDNWDVSMELDNNIINSLIKANSSLLDNENVNIKVNNKKVEFEFGGDDSYNNKVSFALGGIEYNMKLVFNTNYNSIILKEILSANKDMASCFMYLNKDGIMKIKCNNDITGSLYYIVGK